ncbi:MAG: hypothetical protein LBF26_00945 [Puniceicoccales bacterium]|jgi:hypothetical protein|nr:hypothetical protein [Puniceicoccales bacterium]
MANKVGGFKGYCWYCECCPDDCRRDNCCQRVTPADWLELGTALIGGVGPIAAGIWNAYQSNKQGLDYGAFVLDVCGGVCTVAGGVIKFLAKACKCKRGGECGGHWVSSGSSIVSFIGGALDACKYGTQDGVTADLVQALTAMGTSGVTACVEMGLACKTKCDAVEYRAKLEKIMNDNQGKETEITRCVNAKEAEGKSYDEILTAVCSIDGVINTALLP